MMMICWHIGRVYVGYDAYPAPPGMRKRCGMPAGGARTLTQPQWNARR